MQKSGNTFSWELSSKFKSIYISTENEPLIKNVFSYFLSLCEDNFSASLVTLNKTVIRLENDQNRIMKVYLLGNYLASASPWLAPSAMVDAGGFCSLLWGPVTDQRQDPGCPTMWLTCTKITICWLWTLMKRKDDDYDGQKKV